MLKRQWKLTLAASLHMEEERKSPLQKRLPQTLLELI